jgi:PBP1b-binding outer membrane lipoprotein LpoB
MKSLSVLAMVAVLLNACSAAVPTVPPVPNETPGLSVTTPAVQASSIYKVTDDLGYVNTYFVDPGVDDQTPPLGGRVVVRARLYKNDVRLGVISHVTWVQGGELQVCDLFPAYLSGCIIEVRDFTPGVFVPITVTARYMDMVFRGYGGFTPQ